MKKLSYIFVVLAVMGLVAPAFAAESLSDITGSSGRTCAAASTQSDSNEQAVEGVSATTPEAPTTEAPAEE